MILLIYHIVLPKIFALSHLDLDPVKHAQCLRTHNSLAGHLPTNLGYHCKSLGKHIDICRKVLVQPELI
jgi:hypothetical protein